MRRNLLAAGAAALMLISGGAGAAAWSQGSIGEVSVDQLGSGANFGYFTFGQDLEPGQSYSQTFSYSFTLHNDGLEFPYGVTRSWNAGCSPFGNFGPQCPPAFTGYEQVQFNFGYDESQYGSAGFAYTVTGSPPISVSLAAGQAVTLQGSFEITETNISTDPLRPYGPFGPASVLQVYFSEWVDSVDSSAPSASLVPEADGGVQWLTGAAILVAALRRRLSSAATRR
jgi:hypothetical protein